MRRPRGSARWRVCEAHLRPISRAPEPAGAGEWRTVAERQDALREAAAERRRLEAERRARDEARAAPKARGRHRPR